LEWLLLEFCAAFCAWEGNKLSTGLAGDLLEFESLELFLERLSPRSAEDLLELQVSELLLERLAPRLAAALDCELGGGFDRDRPAT